MRIKTFPGFIKSLPLGKISYVPLMATGTISTPDLIASTIAPALKSCILPSLVLVPSGKMITEVPAEIFCAASPMLFKACLPRDRSTGIYPALRMAGPQMGTLKSSFLASQRKSIPRNPCRAKISNWLWWFAAKIYGFSASRCSLPVTVTTTPLTAQIDLAHQAARP